MLLSELEESGVELFNHLTDANVSYSMGGLGGSSVFKIENYPEEFRKPIKDYVTTDKGVIMVYLEYLYSNHLLNENIRGD